jgi:hypothetical protein
MPNGLGDIAKAVFVRGPRYEPPTFAVELLALTRASKARTLPKLDRDFTMR